MNNQYIDFLAKELGTDKEWFTAEETLAIPEIYYKKFGKVPYYEILNILKKMRKFYQRNKLTL